VNPFTPGTDPMTGPVSEGYPLAGFWVRLGAAFIDGVLIFVVLIL